MISFREFGPLLEDVRLPGNLHRNRGRPQRSTDRAKALSKACAKLDWINCSFDWEAGTGRNIVGPKWCLVIGNGKGPTGPELWGRKLWPMYSILWPQVNFEARHWPPNLGKRSLSWISLMHALFTLHSYTSSWVCPKMVKYSPSANFYGAIGFWWILMDSCNFPTNPDLHFHELLRSVGASSNRAANSLTSIRISESPEAPKVWWKVGYVSVLSWGQASLYTQCMSIVYLYIHIRT